MLNPATQYSVLHTDSSRQMPW